ncbi:serine/threonine-protein kinase [Chitinophaga sp. S165]|uniref:protein kinase domain-containing protein n=1 Tax=Chitinophaga sp. S165 TaxID=2135462 RepID=UPI000D71D90B|nr:serine/threonine-protein kinase [Chitinophaga sp. S165]PWV47056.1 protein kinase-like protein [Chitinophaga sp. S165]
MENPTEYLLNLELEDEWVVIERINQMEAENGMLEKTGGNFSIGYKVQRGDDIAFLKAFDISRALTGNNRMLALNQITTMYLYEKELLDICKGQKMDKVVKILAAGEVQPIEHNPNKHFVPYLIFELAETTIRDHLFEVFDAIDNACLMRSLHDVAVGISQLHGAGIAHQDIKCSNVLLFDKGGNCKVADLGRAENKENKSPIFNMTIAGDPDYAPPEQKYRQKYRYTDQEWETRRIATDLYHLGSLITFYYTQSPMTSLYATVLPPELQYGVWNGTYEEILPDMKNAFSEILQYLEEQLEDRFSDKQIASEIMKLVKYLCDPDPCKRGHPDSHATSRYSMERFISIFDRLTTKFESKLM